MEIRLLGPLEVHDAGSPVPIRRPKERALLALLAAEPGRVVSADLLMDGLWGGSPPATAAKTLQTYVHHLRAQLPDGAIVTEAAGYRLQVEPEQVDAHRFVSAVTAARDRLADDPHDAAQSLAAALSAWRGEAFADAGDAENLRPLRTRLGDLRVQARTDAIAAQIRLGQHDRVLPDLRALVNDHPLREDLWALYLLALYRSGRQAEALHAFTEARRRLVDELGVEPGPDLRALHERILAQDPALLGAETVDGGGVAEPSTGRADDPVRPTAPVGPAAQATADRPGGAPHAEQRLATVVRAELLGLEELQRAAGAGDAARILAEAADAVAAAFERLGGTVVRSDTAEVLATFGAPVTREDDTYRAIRAALLAHETVADRSREIEHSWGVAGVAARSAVHTLPVTMPFDEPDVADAASRPLREIAAVAAPGDVLVEDRSRRLMGELFAWDPEPAHVPAIGAVAWRARSVRRTADKARMGRRLYAPMVGRDAEMAVAADMLGSLRRGIGGILLVAGDAGVGKTRLLTELQRVSEVVSLTGHCAAYAEAMPYWPVRGLLRSWLELGPDDTDLKARVTLHRRLDEEVRDDADRLYPYLGGVLGLTLEPSQAARLRLAPEALQYRTFEAVTELLSGLARRRPLMVTIEDVHWADPTSIQLVEKLLPLTTEVALLVVLTTRPDPDHPSRRLAEQARHRHPHVTREIALGSLGDGAQRALLDALVGAATLPAPTARRILDLAEGNPFYLEELLGSLVDEGALVHTPSGWRFDHDTAVTVPETVEKVVQARIDRLDPRAHELLTAASVLGRSFGLPLLLGITDGSADIVPTVQHLLRLDLLVEARRWPQAEYLFKHVLIQEAAYRTIPDGRRADLHRRAAEWLEHRHRGSRDEAVGLLARHWAAAGVDEKAAPALLRAGDVARRDHALDEAIDHYRRLLPILERRGDRQAMALVLLKLALALHTSLRFAESNDTYQQAFLRWEPPPSTEPTATLRFSSLPQVIGPDPVRSYVLQDIQLQMALLDRLVERWPDDTIVPSLAERWEISDDGLRYVFHLRDGLTWSDGHPLTASDVEYGIKRKLDPRRPGAGVAIFFVLTNAQDYTLGRVTDPGLVGVRALDDRTVEFRLASPAPYFLGLLNRPDAGPQPRHAVERYGDQWIAVEHEVVSGPFRRRPAGTARTVLERRPDYQGRRLGNVRTVEWIAESPAESTAAYRRGDRDLVWIRSLSHDASGLDGIPGGEIRLEPATGTSYLAFDHRSAAMGDARLRRALAHAIDRTALAESLPPHLSAATGGLVPPALAGHTPEITPRFDPGLARRLLSESPVAPRAITTASAPAHVLRVTDTRIRGTVVANLLDAVTEQWRRHLGLEVTLVPEEPDDAGAAVDVHLCGWYPGYPDPEYYLRLLLHSEAEDNIGRFSHPPYDDLIERARQERDERTRLALFHEADRMAVTDQVTVIPLAYSRNIALCRPGVRGWWELGKSWAGFADLTVTDR